MGYYIDLTEITLDAYQSKLATTYLPPSRMILKERLKERFDHLREKGYNNVEDLKRALKKKDKLEELQKLECLSGDYLMILLRELNSVHPKPNKIAEFTGISKNAIGKLERIGIKNTVKLYELVLNTKSRRELAYSSGIQEDELLELTKLTDLSRIKWVGVTFARMLYDLGLDTAKKASQTDPDVLHQQINQLNKEKRIYKGQIGLNDIRIFVEAAKEVPLEIEY